ncbi:MAG: glycoside hydrolase family 3 protein [Rhodobacteraceae bacterium]|nr:glycoside hydrolase family 3 protein [Paracoccaceae bacterium]
MTGDALLRDAHAVLLPAFEEIPGPGEVEGFLGAGGVALLLGMSRAEFVARRMAPARIALETPAAFAALAGRARAAAGGPVLIAIDYEIGGLQRLHRLGPALARPAAALAMAEDEVEGFGAAAARAARALGITLILAPVLDLAGPGPWLAGRCLAAAPEAVARVAAAFIRGLQGQGVAATAKHFPGHARLAGDPFDDPALSLEGPRAMLAPGLLPFRSAIAAGVRAVMTGPVPVTALDPGEPASTSAAVIGQLRAEMGFSGLVISDDLDLPATLRGRGLEATALAGLDAGADLLLLAAGPGAAHATRTARAIAAAAAADAARRMRLAAAAAAVRGLARDLR